jgi:protein-tyrosine phosphatase
MRPDIYKIELIGSGFLAVMAKPISGEWIEDEFSSIANEGILQIVSLLETHEEIEVGLVNEKVITEKNGMEFLSYPIKDRGLPNSIEEFSRLTKRLYHQIAGGKNTVVHCRAGIGRTGIFAAGVLLHCGFKPEDAFSLISKRRGVHVPDTEEQKSRRIG